MCRFETLSYLSTVLLFDAAKVTQIGPLGDEFCCVIVFHVFLHERPRWGLNPRMLGLKAGRLATRLRERMSVIQVGLEPTT